jgi:ferredoxin
MCQNPAGVKRLNHLVKAMAEGVTIAARINQFLEDRAISTSSRVFSSAIGRLDREELKVFIQNSWAGASVNPCDACGGFNRGEAALEASRCLHCDCRSSGDCALQSYAQLYEVNASRYRQQRRSFEQLVQRDGIIFEPGKCIRCGICVKLTELAREPLGLTFIVRGFAVRIATPFNKRIEEGMRKTAAECVEHCPTGALAFR